MVVVPMLHVRQAGTFICLRRLSTDPMGNRMTYDYDVMDRTTRITDAQSNVTQMTFDALSNVIAVTDAKSNITQFAYDSKKPPYHPHRPDPLLANESYQYDAMGNLTRHTDRKTQITFCLMHYTSS